MRGCCVLCGWLRVVALLVGCVVSLICLCVSIACASCVLCATLGVDVLTPHTNKSWVCTETHSVMSADTTQTESVSNGAEATGCGRLRQTEKCRGKNSAACSVLHISEDYRLPQRSAYRHYPANFVTRAITYAAVCACLTIATLSCCHCVLRMPF